MILGGLLIAFVALIALANGILGGIGGWFGIEDLTFQQLLGWIFAPIAWLIGVPWSEAATVGSLLGQKTVINEFVAFASFGPLIPNTGPEDGVDHHLRARWFCELRLDRHPDRRLRLACTRASRRCRLACWLCSVEAWPTSAMAPSWESSAAKVA